MLIVNADDWGASRETTDAILRCFAASAITSTTAMVHMPDSRRAAALALEHRLPVGLHLNLTQLFDAPDAPDPVRLRQARIADRFATPRARRFHADPLLLAEVRRAVADQLEAFTELYGAPPTHLDGHNHVHLNPLVLAALPSGLKIRPPADGNGTMRSARAAMLRRRFRVPDAFVSIRAIHPELGGSGLEEALAPAAGRTLEVMCHPGWDDERALLLSDGWRATLAGHELGGYDAL